MGHILIVEDQPKLASLLHDYLVAAGYQARCLSNGLDVVPAVRAAKPSLILLDIMLPGRDGLEVCRDLRSFSDVPIVLITARIEESDRLQGLDLGADDYICKPFSPREVVARVKAILRRGPLIDEEVKAPRLIVDPDHFRATLDGIDLGLTPVEMRLLHTLANAPGRVFSRDQLMDKLYFDHRVVTDRTVDSHIKNLRRKLDLVSSDEEIVQSIYGVGYTLKL